MVYRAKTNAENDTFRQKEICHSEERLQPDEESLETKTEANDQGILHYVLHAERMKNSVQNDSLKLFPQQPIRKQRNALAETIKE